jgi:hypothetical protein
VVCRDRSFSDSYDRARPSIGPFVQCLDNPRTTPNGETSTPLFRAGSRTKWTNRAMSFATASGEFGGVGARPALLPAFSLRSLKDCGSGFSPYRQVGQLGRARGGGYVSRLEELLSDPSNLPLVGQQFLKATTRSAPTRIFASELLESTPCRRERLGHHASPGTGWGTPLGPVTRGSSGGGERVYIDQGRRT